MATATKRRTRVKVAEVVREVPTYLIPPTYTAGQLVKLYRMCKADPHGFALRVKDGYGTGHKLTPAGWLDWFRAKLAEKLAYRTEQANPRPGRKHKDETHNAALGRLVRMHRERFVVHPTDLNGIRGERVRAVVAEWVSY